MSDSVPAERPRVLRFSDKFPARPQFGERLRLRIVQGADLGIGYCLMGDSLTIGREEINEIVLDDEKTSRRHVELTWKKERYFARDLDSANGLIINGKKIKGAFLEPGDLITIGNSVIETIGVGKQSQLGDSMQKLKAASGKKDSEKDNLKKKRTTVLLILFIVAMFALSSNEQVMTFRERAFITFIDQEKPEKKLSKAESKEAIKDFVPGSDGEAPGFKQAQKFYKEGMRELQNRNYRRAISAFETAQTVDPTHSLARVYVDIAKKALETEVQTNYRAALSSVRSQRYREARMYYLTVLRLLEKDPDNKFFQDATEALKSIEKVEAQGGR